MSSHPQDRAALPCLDLVLPTTLPVGWSNRNFLSPAAWPLAAPHFPNHPIGSKHPIGSNHSSSLPEHMKSRSPHLPVPDQLETPLTFCCSLSLYLQQLSQLQCACPIPHCPCLSSFHLFAFELEKKLQNILAQKRGGVLNWEVTLVDVSD